MEAHDQKTTRIISTEYAGKLTFDEIGNPKTMFNYQASTPELVFQREHRAHLLVINFKKEQKLFRIKDNRIEFVSEHFIYLPFNDPPSKTIFSETRVRQYYKMANLLKNQKNKKFLGSNNLDLNPKSRIVVEWRYGMGLPKNIRPRIFQERISSYQNISNWNFVSFLCNRIPLQDTRLCFVKGCKSARRRRSLRSNYLAEIYKRSLQRPRMIFVFKQKFEENSLFFKRKIDKDSQQGFNSSFQNRLNFFPTRPHLHGKAFLGKEIPSKAPIMKPFITVFERMIVVQVMNLRIRRTTVTSFLSIFELFGALNLTRAADPLDSNGEIREIHYSPKIDTLVIDMTVSFQLHPPDQQNRRETVDQGNSVGKLDISDDATSGTRLSKLVRFRVSGLLKGEARRICAELVEDFSSFKAIPEGILYWKEENDFIEIQIDCLGNKTTQRHSSAIQRDGEKVVKRALSKTTKQVVTSSSIKLKKGVQFPDDFVKNLFYFEDNNTLLAVCESNLLLIDRQSRKLISSVQYCQNLPTSIKSSSAAKFDKDLLVSYHKFGAKNEFRVYKLLDRSEVDRSPFKLIGELDLTRLKNSVDTLHLLDLKKVSGDTYQLMAYIGWKVDELSFSKLSSIKFRLLKEPQDKQYSLEVESCQPLFEYPDLAGYNIYWKKREWNYLCVNYCFVSIYQVSFQDDFNILSRKYTGSLDFGKQIINAHARSHYVYLVVHSEDKSPTRYERKAKEIVMLQFEKIGDDGSMMRPTEKLRFKQVLPGDVFFDEVTDDFRIFSFTYCASGGFVNLKLMSAALEVIESFRIEGIVSVGVFEVVDSSLVYISATRSRANQGRRSRVNLVVNLVERTCWEVVDGGGEALVEVPRRCSDGRLIMFTGSLESICSFGRANEGIYVSDCF